MKREKVEFIIKGKKKKRAGEEVRGSSPKTF